MVNELKVFENNTFGAVRVIEIDGKPWFVGKDVAECLGYGKGKSLNNAVSTHVDDDDKGVTEMMTPGGEEYVYHRRGEPFIGFNTLITPKGQEWIITTYLKELKVA